VVPHWRRLNRRLGLQAWHSDNAPLPVVDFLVYPHINVNCKKKKEPKKKKIIVIIFLKKFLNTNLKALLCGIFLWPLLSKRSGRVSFNDK
jgi:hypothetical protein